MESFVVRRQVLWWEKRVVCEDFEGGCERARTAVFGEFSVEMDAVLIHPVR